MKNTLFSLVLAIGVLEGGTAAAQLLAPDAQHGVETRRHVGIPSLCASPKTGRMWATWYAGPTAGEDANNYCVLTTSADGGETWKEVLISDPDGKGPVRSFDPNVWITPQGRLVWSWTERTCPPFDPDNPYAGCSADPRFDRLTMAELDADAEPSAPYPALRVIGRGVMMDKPTFLSNGDWLLPVAHWYENPSACFLRSTDGGKTFVETNDGVHVPKLQRLFDEHQTVELKDGTLLCLVRAQNGPTILKSLSPDRGESWTLPVDSGLGNPCSRFFIRRLASGNLLLVKHGQIGENRKVRDNLMAFVSRDDGRTWQGGLMLDDRGDGTGVSYPDGCQLRDGTIAICYDYSRVDRRVIHFATFTEADASAGRDVSGKVRLRRVISRPDRQL